MSGSYTRLRRGGCGVMLGGAQCAQVLWCGVVSWVPEGRAARREATSLMSAVVSG
jgi:hypothetical protein